MFVKIKRLINEIFDIFETGDIDEGNRDKLS